MFGSAELRLSAGVLLLMLGVLANLFNLSAVLLQRRRAPRLVRTAGVVICLVSGGNAVMQACTFALVASVWAGVLCRAQLPLFFCVFLFLWLSSGSVSFWSVACLSLLYCVRVLRFSSLLFRTVKAHISSILHVTLALTFVTSCVMFVPFLFLHVQTPAPQNTTEEEGCVLRKPLFPVWVDLRLYVVVFVCYVALMPSIVLLPTSVSLVVFLCRHSVSVQKKEKKKGAESYLLLCRLTVALVGVFLSTLLIISLYFLHATFAAGLSADMLFLGLSFYCSASAALLAVSNRKLREKLRVLLRRERKRKSSPATRSGEDKSGDTATV